LTFQRKFQHIDFPQANSYTFKVGKLLASSRYLTLAAVPLLLALNSSHAAGVTPALCLMERVIPPGLHPSLRPFFALVANTKEFSPEEKKEAYGLIQYFSENGGKLENGSGVASSVIYHP
jgi:hypothetical protein